MAAEMPLAQILTLTYALKILRKIVAKRSCASRPSKRLALPREPLLGNSELSLQLGKLTLDSQQTAAQIVSIETLIAKLDPKIGRAFFNKRILSDEQKPYSEAKRTMFNSGRTILEAGSTYWN